MALNVGSLPVSGVYAGSTEVQKVYVGSVLVWENRETVAITGTSGTQARDSFRAALTSRGLNYKTIKTIPFLLDTSQVTSMYSMFNGCSSLTSVPDMDTSKVTDMSAMFYGCAALTSVPDMNTSKVMNMASMFYDCTALTSVPNMNTSNVADMSYLFYRCAALTSVPDMNTGKVANMRYMFYYCIALTYGNVRCIGKKRGVDTTNMTLNSGLTRLPFYDTNGNWTG